MLVLFGLLTAGSPAAVRNDPLQDAIAQYRKEAGKASEQYVRRMVPIGTKLLDGYDRALAAARGARDEERAQELAAERARVEADLHRLEREGPGDPLDRLLGELGAAVIPDALPRADLVACFDFSERGGATTFDAVAKTAHPIGAALWSEVEGEPALDFRPPLSAVRPVRIPLRPEWTALVRAHFPLDLQGHKWSTLFAAEAGRHHALVDSLGELGVFADGFHGSGARVTQLKGWHLLAVRVGAGKSAFFLDGKLAGTSDAAITDPIQSIGNVPWASDSDAQPCALALSGVAVYGRALSDKELESLAALEF